MSVYKGLMKEGVYEGIGTQSTRSTRCVRLMFKPVESKRSERGPYTFDSHLGRDTASEGRNDLLKPAAARNNCWSPPGCCLAQNAARCVVVVQDDHSIKLLEQTVKLIRGQEVMIKL